MRRSSVDKARESLRLQQVYNVFLRYGWDIVFDRSPGIGAFRRSMQAWVWNLPGDWESPSMPVKTRMMLEELGPTYVKVGQIVSSQASMIPSEWQVELNKLQSDVPPFAEPQVRQTIIEELGAPPEEVYATFDVHPFAAASTAQVHKATLHDGTVVAVKVQRPDIRSQMKSDIGIMESAARVVARRSELAKSIDLVGMLDQFGGAVLLELDYTGEAYNAYKMGENMSTLPGVHIPIVYRELSTSRVMTQEFIRGVKISNVEAVKASGVDRSVLALNAMRAIVKQLLIDGFFHADPHPGNILVNLDTGVLTFIDLGMVGELSVQDRVSLVQLLVAIQQSDVKGMARVLRGVSVPYRKHVDDEAFYKAFERTVGRFTYGGQPPSVGQVVGVMFDLLREHGLRLDPNLTLAVKAMMQAEAIVAALSPEFSLANEGIAMVKDMFVQTVTAEKVTELAKDQLMNVGRGLLQRLPTLSDATFKWLTQYEKGRFEVYVDTSGIAKEVSKIERLGRQMLVAILLVGMIIGSAIATAAVANTSTQNQLNGVFFRLAYVGYIVAMFAAILIVIPLVWRWVRGKTDEEEE